jgi:hypothetical protein
MAFQPIIDTFSAWKMKLYWSETQTAQEAAGLIQESNEEIQQEAEEQCQREVEEQRRREEQAAKDAEEARRRKGPLLRLSGDVKDIEDGTLAKLHVDVRVLIDHIQCMYKYKAEIRSLSRFVAVDPDYEGLHEIIDDEVANYDPSAMLDKPEDEELKKTKRALIHTFVCYKRQVEWLHHQVDYAIAKRDTPTLQQERNRWRKINWSDVNSDLRNKASHCYRCAAELGHDEFNSRLWWAAVWPAIRGVLEDAEDLEECVYRTILFRKGNDIDTATPNIPASVQSQPPPDVAPHLRSLLHPVIDTITWMKRSVLRYIHRKSKQLAKATDVWEPVDLESGSQIQW